MSNITEFNRTDCCKLDPQSVDAYFTLSLDPTNNNLLKLDTSWGCTEVDISPIVGLNETITHLFITPEGSLQFNREDYGREGAENGGVDCITGKALSRIISMQYLKDVSQDTAIAPGDVYMYDTNSELFQPFALQAFVTNTNVILEQHSSSITQLLGGLQSVQNTLSTVTARLSAVEKRLAKAEADITGLTTRMGAAEASIASLQGRVSSIESRIARPAGVPDDTRLVYGNINYVSDSTNSGSTATGLYSHNPATKKVNDAYDA